MNVRLRALLPVATFLVAFSVSAQTPTLVKDIHPGASSTPSLRTLFDQALGASGNKGYLSGMGYDGSYGVWVTDGTVAGTRQLLDLGSSSGADVAGTFFFSSTSTGGAMIWKTNGTAAGTSFVSRISTDPSVYATATKLTGAGSRLFFLATDGIHGRELWTCDGTAAGTRLVKDVTPGPIGSFDDAVYAARLVDVGGTLFFSCGTGCGLWKSDGTEGGTIQLADLASVGSLVNVNGTLFFVATDSTHGTELWKSDGTAAGTVLVRDIVPGAGSSHPASLVSFAGALFFRLASDGSTWKSDGTETGTVFVHTLPGSDPLLPSGDRLFFANGSQLWAGDGTAAGTTLLRDLGVAFSLYTAATVPGALLFWVDRSGGNLELWRSDGTPAGTELVEAVGPGGVSSYGRASISTSSTAILLTGESPLGLWRSDGSAAGTFLLEEPLFVPNDSVPMWLTDVNGTLLFSAADAEHGIELWRSDGTPGGTVLVKDIEPGAGSSIRGPFLASPSTVFFTAWTSATGSEIYRTDGTDAGTHLIKDIQPGDVSATPLALLGELLVFIADDGIHGTEPWRTDGTDDGTFLLGDLTPGSSSSRVRLVGELNEALYLAVSDGTATTLWRTDGTAAGTVAVGPIPALYWAGAELGGRLYFTVSDPIHGSELWRTDGTAAGTSLFVDVNPAGGSSSYIVGHLGSRLFFWADDGTHGNEPWVTDGTTAGTALLKDINPGPATSSGARSAVVGSTVYFFAFEGVHGSELWKSDGTPAGTVLVRDIAPGPAGSYFMENLAAMGHEILFTASDHVSGREYWRSDGTEAGTARVSDIVPGIGSSPPSWFFGAMRTVPVRSGGRVFFNATDGATGYELWSLPIPTRLHTITPCRIVDTRDPAGPTGGTPLAASQTAVLQVTGLCGIPSTAISVAANVTVVTPSATGSLSVFPGGPIVSGSTEVPVTSGKTRALHFIPGLGTAGALSIRVDLPPGSSTDVILDVSGWFE